jgi:hypothetical protein
MNDKCGQEIKAGDYIVYGHALGRCAALKFGKVIRVIDRGTEAEDRFSLHVIGINDNLLSFGMVELTKRGTLLYGERIIVLPFEMLPDYAKTLLEPVKVV